MKYYVAFYRGRGRLADRIVSFATRSPFTHCELIRSDTVPRSGDTVRCISASGRDRGVRIKDITLDPDKWDIFAVPWAPADTWERAEAHLGAPYELWTMVLSQLFNFRRGSPGRWFCSELIAHALGLELPQAIAPGDLMRDIVDHVDTWELALAWRAANPGHGSAGEAADEDPVAT